MSSRVDRRRTMHLLREYSVFDEEEYPVKLHEAPLGAFSTLRRAEAFLRDERAHLALDPDDDVTHLELDEVELDRRHHLVRRRYYAADGTPRGSLPHFKSGPRGGRPPGPFRFQVGDLVEVRRGGELWLGIVVSQPLTPERTRELWEPITGSTPDMLMDYALGEPYCVSFAEDGDHDHPEECMLSAPRFPVPPELAARLAERMKELVPTRPLPDAEGTAPLLPSTVMRTATRP